MRASLRVYLILYLCFLVHEGAHALVFWMLGYPVSSFILGVGPSLTTTVQGIVYGVAPIPIGAYVLQDGSPPWWVQVIATCAGPLASMGVIVFHPIGPVRRLLPALYQAWKKEGWSPTYILVLLWLRTVLRYWIDLIEAPRPPTVERGILGRLPVFDVLLMWRGWSFWQITAMVGFTNLLPIPPMDGARALLYLLPQTDNVTLGYNLLAVGTLVLLMVVLPIGSIGKYLWGKVQAWRGKA